MFLEDQLSVMALVLAAIGIVALSFLLNNAEPVHTTLGQLTDFPEQSKVVFNARIAGWKELQENDWLELEDGNTVTATAEKKLRSQWLNQQAVFEFSARITQTKPKTRLEILEVKKID